MTAIKVLVLNGVNLGRLGSREPLVYGGTTHAQLAAAAVASGADLGLDVEVRQTDDEAQMIRWLHEAADASTPVVLNPAAWSHYSIALRDAVSQRTAPLVEVHISNVHSREEFRHHSVVSAVATGVIAGLGVAGYALALQFLADTLADTRADTRAEPVPGAPTIDPAFTRDPDPATGSERGDDASGLGQ